MVELADEPVAERVFVSANSVFGETSKVAQRTRVC